VDHIGTMVDSNGKHGHGKYTWPEKIKKEKK
jgi:hypothetical protein